MTNTRVGTDVRTGAIGGQAGDGSREIAALLRDVRGLRRDLVAAADRQAAEIAAVLPRHRYRQKSARARLKWVSLKSR